MKIIERVMRNKERHIAVTHYTPEYPTASIQILHGMAEHKERYKELGIYLALNNIHCVIHNHRGHGSDEKKSELGHFNSFEDLIEDAKTVFRSMPTNVPRIGLGHSMGSIVLRRLLAEDIYDAGIIVGTGSKIKISDKVSGSVLKILAKIMPTYRSILVNELSFLGYDAHFKGTVKNRWLSADVNHVHKYNADAFTGQRMSIKALSEILTNIRYVDSTRCLKKYRDIPYLIIGGQDDPFSNAGKHLEVLNWRLERRSKNVKLELVPNARHEVLFEENRGAMFADIVDWVNEYVKK